MKPAELMNSLSVEDQKILNGVLAVEKRYLVHQDLKAGSSVDKDIVSAITNIIDKVVTCDN